MINLKINNEKIIFKPSHEGDAGFDITATSDPRIVGKEELPDFYSSIDYIEYDTGLIISPDDGYHTYLMPRSSISKTNLILANSVGLIDNGYRGTIKLRFKYIFQPKDMKFYNSSVIAEIDRSMIYNKGDKIGQLVFSKTLIPNLELVFDFEDSTRNDGGFGSTGL
jgi:dUTP pyrophosphatase